MIQSATQYAVPVADQHSAKIKLASLFTAGYIIVFECVHHILTLASIAIRCGFVAPLRHLWAHYYRRVVFGREGVAMPPSALSFIINAMLALAEIKSQGQHGFPFQTHPQAIMVWITSLLVYDLASAAELVVFAAGLDPTSVYAITGHLGKISSLCILIASLASLFYM